MINGSKRQRPDGKWQLIAELGKKPDGSRRQAFKTVGGTSRESRLTKAEAERELHKWLEELEQGGISPPDKVTVSEYLDRWVEEQRTLKSLNTAKTSRGVTETWFKPHLGAIKMQELRPEHVQAMFESMRKHGTAASTIKLYRTHLSAALNRAVKTKIIKENPVTQTAIAKPRKTQHSIWGPKEVRAFADYVAGLTNERIYGQAALLAAYIGPRQGEVVALQRDDYEDGVLHIRRGSTEHKGEVVIHDTKSELGVRDVVLPAHARALVEEVLEQQEFQRRNPGYRDRGFLFADSHGKPLMHSRLHHHFAKIVAAAGLPYITFHELRTSAATWMMDLGLDPTIVADILGHDPKILLGIYRQVKGPQKEAAAEKMAAALAL